MQGRHLLKAQFASFIRKRPVSIKALALVQLCSTWPRTLIIFQCCPWFQMASQKLWSNPDIDYRVYIISLLSLLPYIYTLGKKSQDPTDWSWILQYVYYHLTHWLVKIFCNFFAVFISCNLKQNFKGFPAVRGWGGKVWVMRNDLGSLL